jgi:hypothetical protein
MMGDVERMLRSHLHALRGHRLILLLIKEGQSRRMRDKGSIGSIKSVSIMTCAD